ncbi:antibiotic biosynthesis monooxygenase [Aquimarina spinulae]|uniref:antibiotic biosynthesis monooxygenase n=1 Tax=Aquimarina spinulae TaxID=1192023 RepID=UPI001F3BCAA2|nr:antibiotic biosynthesis monooxygenase [Aquimarina spinulae]
MNKEVKITRIWKGWTTIENADIYENLLVNEIFPQIQKKGIKDLQKVNIYRQNKKKEVEFLLVIQFNSLDSVKAFAGDDYKVAYIPEKHGRYCYDTIKLHNIMS